MASVLLGDLNDFIQPSQACTNPLFVSDKGDGGEVSMASTPATTRGTAKVTLDSGIFSGLRSVCNSFNATYRYVSLLIATSY